MKDYKRQFKYEVQQVLVIDYKIPQMECDSQEIRQFKYEVQHLEILPREAHRGSLVFITTKRLPYEL